MNSSAQTSDSRDYEREFYAILAQSWDSEPAPTTEAVKRDFFDAREGVQAGFTATGEPVFMMTMTPEGVKLVVDACRNWADHSCSASQEIALWVMHVVGQTMLPTLQHMPQVRHFEPFNHSGGGHGVDIADDTDT